MKSNIEDNKNAVPKINSFNCKIIDEEVYHYLLNSIGNMSPFLLIDNMLCILICKTQGKEKYYFIQPIATFLRVIYCNKNLITKECNYTIEAVVNNEFIQFTVSSEVLTVNGLKELLKMGILFDERYAKDIQRYLIISARMAETKSVHTHLGWVDDTFLSYKVYSSNSVLSEYRGNIDFRPKGEKDIYLDMIKSQVLEHTPLLFVWLLGFSSIILSYLNRFYDFGSIIFALNNYSSKGKTTAAMLATSISSNPVFDKGVITNFSGTEKAVLGFVSGCNGHTVVLDEAGTSETTQIRKLLYQICSGRERKRLNNLGELKETAEFNSVVIVTGEHSILDSTAPNGLRCRIIEITDDLTVSAEQSNKIKSCILQNYALLWEDFCFYAVEHTDNILNDYELSVKELKTKYKDNKGELTDRVLEKLAIVYQTSKYVSECFELSLDFTAISDYILQLENRIKGETDISVKAFDLVMQYVTQNGKRFSTEDSADLSNIDGKIVNKRYETHIIILKQVVDKILNENNIDNDKQVCRKWQEMGLILCELDRPYKRLKLVPSLPSQKCFDFLIKNQSVSSKSVKNNFSEEIDFDDSIEF